MITVSLILTRQYKFSVPDGLGSVLEQSACLRHCCSPINESLFRYGKNLISRIKIYICSSTRSGYLNHDSDHCIF